MNSTERKNEESGAVIIGCPDPNHSVFGQGVLSIFENEQFMLEEIFYLVDTDSVFLHLTDISGVPIKAIKFKLENCHFLIVLLM